MSESLAVARPAEPRPAEQGRATALDPRRKLQLALGVLWLLDGILQYQPSMFTKGFPQMLADSAQGNPAVVAAPITWSAGLIGHHVALLNAIFATVQVALGLGIAWRPALRLALAGSVAWSVAVWWLGEGFGGILAGTASPVDGAPGAVILYAVLAVLLWPADRDPADRDPADRDPADRDPADRDPADRDPAARFVAARAIGRRYARLTWLAVWGSMTAFALLPASRAPQAISGMIADMSPGEPTWLAWIDTRLAAALSHQGLPASIVLAVLFALVAAAVYLPARLTRGAVVLALILAVALGLAQGLGGIFTGSATDPNSGPLLALLALAFWPARTPERTA